MEQAAALRAVGPGGSAAAFVSALFAGSGVRLLGSHGDQITTMARSAPSPIWRGDPTELDPLHCDVIVRRWEEFTGRKAKQLITPYSCTMVLPVGLTQEKLTSDWIHDKNHCAHVEVSGHVDIPVKL